MAINQGGQGMFKNAICAAAMAVLVSGCVSVQNKPLAANASQALAHKSLAFTEYARPDFAAGTAGKASFGLLGAVAMIHAGNTIVAENDVKDPAPDISARLASKLAQDLDMQLANAPLHETSDKLGALTASAASSDYLLDVKTLNWQFIYYPTNWSHYRVIYAARMRLIDAHTKAVVAETMCKAQQPTNEKEAPTHEELLADHAAKLKDMLGRVTDGCTDVLAKQVLHI